jgi:serine protease inhibitor
VVRRIKLTSESPEIRAVSGSLLADLNKAGNAGGNELHTANGLWVQKGFAIQPAEARNVLY